MPTFPIPRPAPVPAPPQQLHPLRYITTGRAIEPNPMRVQGLICWLDAAVCYNTGTTQATNGQAVTTWPDLSGKQYNAGQSTSAAKPTFRTAGGPNSRPNIEFDGDGAGTPDHFTFSDVFSSLTSGECFLVRKNDNDTPASGNDAGLWYFGTDAGNSDLAPFSDAQYYLAWGSSARKNTLGTFTNNAWHCLNVSSAPSSWTARINGATLATTGTNTVAFATTPRLGISANVAVAFDGRMACYLMYNRVLSAAERLTVHRYININFGITFS